jgi:hypothetical protein
VLPTIAVLAKAVAAGEQSAAAKPAKDAPLLYVASSNLM